tara:strand:+ start:100 stop:531 length:432 start_codon:yes stop_codon:yes gene_type:complete
MLERIKVGLYVVFAYLGVEVESFMILMIFMCFDSVVGAIKSLRLGNRFNFRTMLWGMALKLCFLIVPLVIALLGKSIGYNLNAAVNITISILTVAEAYSIIGNIYSAKNKVEVEKLDAVSVLLKNLRRIIRSLLVGLMSKLEK